MDDTCIGVFRSADHGVGRRLEGHITPVQVLWFVAAGRRRISAGNDSKMLVWKLESDSQTGQAERSRP